MKKLFFFALLLSACQPKEYPANNALADLSIINDIWTRTDPHHLYKETEYCEHDFTIKNSSDTFTYKRIIVKLSYFDRHHKLIASQERPVRRTVRPHESYRVKGMGAGAVKPGTVSASVTLIKALEEHQTMSRIPSIAD